MEFNEGNNYKHKLINVFYKLLNENFTILDDTVLEQLYEHISHSQKSHETDFTEVLRACTVWLESVLNQWHENILCDDVKRFSVRLFCIVGSTPFGFTTIKHLLPKIKEFFSKSEVKNPSILLPLLDVLWMMINHDEGLSWVLESGAWKDAIKCFYEGNNIYFHRSEVLFIAAILSKLNKHSIHCVDILNFILEKNASNCLLTLKTVLDSESHEIMFFVTKKCEQRKYDDLKVKHTLMVSKFLREIVDELHLMGSELPVKLRCKLAFCLEPHRLCPLTPEDYLEFCKLVITLGCSNFTSDALSSFQHYVIVDKLICNATETFLSLGQFSSVMDLAVFCLGCFYKYKLTPRILSSISIHLENCLISMLVLFLWSYPLQHKSCDPICKMQIIKFLDFKTCSKPTLVQYCHWAVNALESCQGKLLHKTTERVSRELLCCIIGVLGDLCSDRDGPFYTQLRTLLLRMISTINKIVKTSSHYDTQRVLNVIEKLLLATRGDDVWITASTLQLLNSLINMKFSLYISEDRLQFNEHILFSMRNIFWLLKKILNDQSQSSWEIRNGLLEVYQSAVQVGDLRIFKGGIFCPVLELVTKDSSSYVRSSALKVMSQVVTTKNYIDKLSIKDLSDLAFTTLLEDEMPEPRTAACDLLSAMYLNGLINNVCMQEKLFDAVFTCSTKELDWEVKKATLRFWQSTVVKHLSDIGLPIDSFYLHSSIIPKTEDGVSKIIEVMDILSSIGCLKVIWSDLADDREITVSEAASEVINGFINFDKKWGYIDKILNGVNTEIPKETRWDNKFYPKEEFFLNISDDSWRERLASRKHWVAESGDDLSSLMDDILNINSSGESDRNAVDCY
ncbi:uncharacterized protein LOC128991135 isoform X2 [Macrosteles quadrilineatus]|uniref:uncharacterized protein LOC128991135 isoform X2 n=1 Tax=Macrosteles quadrilineatus TaxID=74068 RepID=UPI0023E2B054|nr:uncharacterized protein LOC128991135 isoform X2 [Macrosteles quadrilineatus]